MAFRGRFMPNFHRHDGGTVATVFAFSILPMAVFAGCAIDFAQVVNSQTELQAAVDAATLAYANATSNAATVANNVFVGNLQGRATGTATFSTQGNTYTGTGTVSVPTTLLQVVGVNSVTISRTASVSKQPTPQSAGCLLLKDPSAAKALYVNGSVTLNAPACQIDIASTNAQALYIYGSGNFNVTKICDAGNYYTYGSYMPLIPGTATPSNLATKCAAASDTLASAIPAVTVPATPSAASRSACAAGKTNAMIGGGQSVSNTTYCGTTTFYGAGNVSLSNVTFNGPISIIGALNITANGLTVYDNVSIGGSSTLTVTGDTTWHGTLSLDSAGNLTANSGLHIFKSAVNFNGSNRLRGTNVTFYFASAAAKFAGTGSIDMAFTAPTSGTYANLLMFESPTSCTTSTLLMTGSVLEKKTGIIYLPCRDVTYVGTMSTQADQVSMVLKTLTLNGSYTWSLNKPNLTLSAGGGSGGSYLTR